MSLEYFENLSLSFDFNEWTATSNTSVSNVSFCYFNSQQQSVCTEMAEELRYAIRCDGTKHKATLKRTCNGCSPITTYVPAPMHINHVTSQIVSKHIILERFFFLICELFNKNN